MKTTGKKIMLTAACIFVVGVIFSIIGILLGGWPGLKISPTGISAINKQDDPYVLSKTKIEKFTKADINLDYADIDIQLSEDSNYYVEYSLPGDSGEPTCEVKNDTFTFHQEKAATVFVFLGTIDTGFPDSPYIRLYVPKDTTLKSLVLNNESGDCTLNNVKVETCQTSSDYGTYDIQNCSFDELSISAESSDLKMKDTTAKDFSFTGSYGDISLKKFSSDSTILDLESYDVDIDATKLGTFDYTNDYGELELKVPDKLDSYSFDISVEYGNINLPDSAPLGRYFDEDDEKVYRTEGNSKKTIRIKSESGDVTIH